MTGRTITHTQYEQLRRYPTGKTQRVVYQSGGHPRGLLNAGLIAEDRDGAVTMTDAGRAALSAYRQRWGVAA